MQMMMMLIQKNEIVREHDVTVLVDPKAVFFMVGTTMDYNETELAAEFTSLIRT